jgi:hypothetical protein
MPRGDECPNQFDTSGQLGRQRYDADVGAAL